MDDEDLDLKSPSARTEGDEDLYMDDEYDEDDEMELPLSLSLSQDSGIASSSPSTSSQEALIDKLMRMRGKSRRKPGRPKKDRPARKSLGIKIKNWKSSSFVREIVQLSSGPSKDSKEVSVVVESQTTTTTTSVEIIKSPTIEQEPANVDDTDPAEAFAKTDKMSAPDEPPLFQEQWPGKVCGFCNLGERSQLGQGEMLRLICPSGFTPNKTPESPSPSGEKGDKSPRGPGQPAVTIRRTKSLSKCRNPSVSGEVLDELSIVGFSEEPEISSIFHPAGHFFTHHSCALWAAGVTRLPDLSLENVGPSMLQASSRRCSLCNHFGASVTCTVATCQRFLHYPCVTASGAFQDCSTLTMVCSQHLDQVPLLLSGDVACITCFALGDVSNLIMCTSCGNHYHGSCVGLALLPGVRSGWQCHDCRLCQICRQPDEVSKIMSCETCDKAYHPHCLRPTVVTIPKYGWKCKCCRVCSDCGSRTPGAGQSSRWHAHFTVCDSCYQQRNKGFSCPLCRRAYRAAAHRGMVQCSQCTKFVHGTCDPEADVTTYNHKKELNPDYEYKCTLCKNQAQAGAKHTRKDSTDESFDSSQEMVFPDDSNSDIQDSSMTEKLEETAMRSIGLGKGKPFCASKIAKKKLGIGGTNSGGRPKGSQGKVAGYNKRQKTPDFARKRSSKSKMRGIFGVPGLGLQRPQGDAHNKSEEEPGVENRLVLCSSKDKFVLTQDICVMCGSIGMDQEGCLIPCAQCGQCYHPYCVNVKVTKVILQKGWRCLDCTVCEGCGQRNDEARLILCDDCDISFHIYCMDPPLDYVPHGNWKCKWCATCLSCGANDPGFNCSWQKSFTECGPCSSHSTCPSCAEPFTEGELVMKCVQCERWLHGSCDQVRTEEDAERCSDEGYNCVLCRPRDVPPPHLLPLPPPPKPPTPTKSPEPPKLHSAAQFYMDGVCLSEIGLHQIKSLTPEQQQRKKRVNNNRKPVIVPPTKADKEAGILATIESVVSGGVISAEGGCLEVPMECDEVKEEVFKEGMEVSPRPDGRPPEPPEGFNIYTTENGVMLLRRKRQRNLQKLGIGGFLVRLRGVRRDKDEEGYEGTPAPPPPPTPAPTEPGPTDDKPRRKPQRRKPKSKLVESYPSYLQEAFFGRDLLDTKDPTKDLESSSDSEDDKTSTLLVTEDKTIQLSQDELKAMEALKLKDMKDISKADFKKMNSSSDSIKSPGKDDDESDSEALKDILPGDLLDTDLVNTIMNEDDDITKTDDSELNDTLSMTSGTTHKDELTDILSPHFNLESMVRDTTGLPNMDCKDVEEIFKGVLTDESQESQECVLPLGPPVLQPGAARPGPVQSSLSSPISLPYHSEYSNSPQFSPAFSEPPSPWLPHTPHSSGGEEGTETTPAPYNQRSTIKMEADEALGQGATISSVLFANMNHPEWKKDHPVWAERCKQILKTWRALSADRKAPYLQKARDNRAALRMKKAQQIPKELPKQRVEVTPATSPLAAAKKVAPSSPVAAVPPPAVSTGGPPEVCHQEQQLTCSSAASSGGVVTNRDTNPPPGEPTTTKQDSSNPRPERKSPTPPPARHPQQLTPDSKPQQLTLGPHLIHYPGVNSHKSKTIHHLQSPSPQQHPVRNPFSSVTNPHSTDSAVNSAPLHHSSPNPSPIQHSPSNPSPFQRPSPNPSPIQHQSPLSQTLQHPSPNPSPFQHLSPSSLPVQSSPPNQHAPQQTFPPTQHPSPSPSPFPHSLLQHPTPLPHPFTTVFHQSINPHIVHLPQPSSNSMQHPPTISSSVPTPHHLPSNPATIQHLPSNSPLIPPHHQYTVHHYHPFQSGIVTPAPNVVVTRDPIGSIPGSADRSLSSPGSTDQQIRVLTPSEIMRTLPSLGQENYDLPTSTDQDKIMQQQKTCREAEQERQWKQLQALRQQQAQQQQQVIQEQRTQAIARVHRQIVVDDPSITQQLQVSTSQDGSSVGPLSSPSPGSRIPIKVARIQSPGGGNIFNIPSPLQVRPNLTLTLPRGTPTSSVSFSPQSPHETVGGQFEGDGYTPKPQFVPQSPTRSPIYVPRPMPTPRQAQPTYSGPRQQVDPYTSPGSRTQDPYASQPQTPRPALDSYPNQPQLTRPDSFPTQIVRTQDSFNPRPVQDPFGLQPPTPRPQDPYASQPQTPRPLDPYASQPQTPRPGQEGFSHPYASQPQTPRPPQPDPFTTLGSPSPSASPRTQDSFGAARGDAYGNAPQTPRPIDPYASQPQTPRPAQDTFVGQTPNARNVDPYGSQPATPRPDPFAAQPPTPRPIDPYASQPQTPRTQEPPRSPAPRPDPFSSTHPNQRVQDPYASQDVAGRSQEGFASSPSQPSPSDAVQGAEVTRQLRDLLQREQQFKKMDQEAMPPGGRIWNPQQDGQASGPEAGVHPALQQSQQNQHFECTVSGKPGSGDTTFRQPLPPALARPPRIPTPSVGIRGPPRLPTDPRLQSVDPRIRLILQQQQQRASAAAAAAANASYPPGHIQQRLAAPRNPLDPYDHLVQREPVPFSQVQGAMNCGFITHRVARPGENPVVRLRCPTPDQGTQAPRNLAADSQQEIPESVTAELEKLEQEVEVSAILADLGDDDELLEMGNDFNILEYADPELDNIGCDKANILDDLEEPDVKMKHEKAKSAGQQQQATPGKQSPQIKQESSTLPPCTGSATNSVTAIPSIATIHQPGNNSDINRTRITQVDQHQQQLRVVAASQGGGAPAVRPSAPPGGGAGARMGLPPPPPPYPGPPPPYPGPGHQQQGIRGIGVGFPLGPPRPPPTNVMMIGSGPQAQHHLQSLQRRPPLLLQEQPLLLEDLLEQEKREQEKQQQHQPEGSALLSDVDFERLRADVLGTNPSTSPVQGLPAQNLLPNPGLASVVPGVLPSLRAPYPPRGPAVGAVKVEWQEPKLRPPAPSPLETPARVPLFNAPHLPAPPVPPDQILTEQDRQTQLIYEQWLNHQNQVVTSQLKYYETEVQKLRKVRKSLNSKQRQLRKSGNELAEQDASELQRISAEQAILQKQLDASRKQSRQHGMLIQEYRGKQQQKRQQQQQSAGVATPASPQSPLLSPSPSLQHSPLQSPLLHSPNSLGEESPFSPSPGNQELLRSPQGVNPRLPTPPGRLPLGVPFAGQQFVGSRFVRVPGSQDLQRPRAPAMFGPQAVRSGVVYSPQPIMSNVIGQTVGQNQQAQAGSPLGAAPSSGQQPQTMQQMQQQLARQQQIAQQLGEQQAPQRQQSDENTSQMLAQRQQQLQMVQQRQMLQQQQQLALQQRQALLQQALQQQQQQQGIAQPQLVTTVQQLTPQQRQQLMQQQMQKQLQQQAASQGGPPRSPMVQQSVGGQQYGGNQPPSPMFPQPPSSPMPPRSPMVQASPQYNQNQPPSSPMPPKSPMIQQFHNQPPNSPMPPRSPMVQQFNQNQPPSSPMPPRSPMIQQFVQNQPPSSPMPPRSPMVGQNQPPNSPMPPKSPMIPGFNQNQPSNSQFVQNQPPNSPLHPRSPMVPSPMPPRSPMVQSHALGSPLGARHSVSNSPQSGDNPRTPAGEPSASGESDPGNRGGGNPHNPLNPIPFIRYENVRSGLRGGGCPAYSHKPRGDVAFIRYENVKLGLRGGSAMWSQTERHQKSWLGGQKQVDICTSNPGFKVEARGHPTDTGTRCVHKLHDLGPVVCTVASLVATNCNDSEDENSQPPHTVTGAKVTIVANANTKKDSSNTKHEIGISTELELLAESENIVIIEHLSDNVATSEWIQECIVPSADIVSIKNQEKVEQVEITQKASFLVEQRDKVMSETVLKQSIVEPVVDASTTTLEGADTTGVGVNASDVVIGTTCNEEVPNADKKYEMNHTQNENLKCAVVQVIAAAKSAPICEEKRVGNVKEKTPMKRKKIKTSATNLVKGSRGINDNARSSGLEDKFGEEQATVMDLSKTIQGSPKAVSLPVIQESHCPVSELEKHATAVISATKVDPNPPSHLVMNKPIKGISSILPAVAAAEPPDSSTVNVNLSPAPPASKQAGDEAEDITVTNPNSSKLKSRVIASNGAKDLGQDDLVTAITHPTKSDECSLFQSLKLDELSPSSDCQATSRLSRPTEETLVSFPTLPSDTTAREVITSKRRNVIVCRKPTNSELLDMEVKSRSTNISKAINKSNTDNTESGTYVILNTRQGLTSQQESVSFHSSTSTIATPLAISVTHSLQGDLLSISKKQELASVLGGSVNSTRLLCPPATSSPSTATVSVITSVPRTTPATSEESQTTCIPNNSTRAPNLTMLNLPPTSTVPVSINHSLRATTMGIVVPKTPITTLSAISSLETYSPKTSIHATKTPHNLPTMRLQPAKPESKKQFQHSHCLLASNFQAVSRKQEKSKPCLGILASSTQLISSPISTNSPSKQNKNQPSHIVLTSNMEPLSIPTVSAHQNVDLKLSLCVSDTLERTRNESIHHELVQNQSSVGDKSEQARTRPLFDASLKCSVRSDRTVHTFDDS